MKSRTVADFWKQFYALPPDVQERANRAYRQWRANPFAHGLYFKRVSDAEPLYSVRIGRKCRAVGLLEGDTMFWYFIGKHEEYDRELKR